ncbi:MAG: prepilin-type N-terminal cleavage/methylation domain-containing protein [Verrucomicrobiae bacterium]|nr:prepilin-type N-terminal cleavage/methylation domain-containing protein [Verrucomicrobiae bacterium]
MRLKTQRIQKKARGGFTLVEMIGVLAIIAILASLLIPRVFQAIGDSKISNAATTCNSIKAAVNEYYGKHGLIAGPGGTSLTFTNGISEDWDLTTLVAEGVAEKPFSVRIGNGQIGSANNGSRLRVIQIGANVATNAPVATDMDAGTYALDGSDVNRVIGSLVVEAVIVGVDHQDAKSLNDRLDGPTLGEPLVDSGGSPLPDLKGRVKYTTPDAGGKVDVHIYLAHR